MTTMTKSHNLRITNLLSLALTVSTSNVAVAVAAVVVVAVGANNDAPMAT